MNIISVCIIFDIEYYIQFFSMIIINIFDEFKVIYCVAINRHCVIFIRREYPDSWLFNTFFCIVNILHTIKNRHLRMTMLYEVIFWKYSFLLIIMQKKIPSRFFNSKRKFLTSILTAEIPSLEKFYVETKKNKFRQYSSR